MRVSKFTFHHPFQVAAVYKKIEYLLVYAHLGQWIVHTCSYKWIQGILKKPYGLEEIFKTLIPYSEQ